MGNTMTRRSPQFSTYLPPALGDLLKEAAQSSGLGDSATVRVAIIQYLRSEVGEERVKAAIGAGRAERDS